jgi:hypothetical protein
MGEHVLFFSLEQNRLEMDTKSLSQITAQRDRATAVSAMEIRCVKLDGADAGAIADYTAIAGKVSVVNAGIDFLVGYVEKYMKGNPGSNPVVVVDYLQIIPRRTPGRATKRRSTAS